MTYRIFLNPVFSFTLPQKQSILLTIVTVLLCLSILVAAILTLVLNRRGSLSRARSLHSSEMNVRVYRYNFANKTFYCFDKFEPSNTKEFTEKEFLAQFFPSDKYRVQDWLKDIAHGENHPRYIQADIRISKDGKMIPTMLEFTSINHKASLIHFDSHLFPSLFSANQKNTPKRMRKFLLANEEMAQRFLESEDQEALGATFCFTIYQKEPNGRVIINRHLADINQKIVEVIGRFLTKNRKILILSPFDEIVIDTSVASRTSAYTIASTIATSIQQYLNYSIPDDDIYYAIGFSVGSFYGHDYPKAKFQSSSMVKAIKEGYSQEKILFYDSEFYAKYAKRQSQNQEINMVVKDATFRIYYMPSLDLSKKELAFYFTDIVPYGTEISDFQSVIRMAAETDGDAEQLLESVVSRCEADLAQRARTKIAIRLPYAQLETFRQILRKHRKLDWIVEIREADLTTYAEDIANVNSELIRVRQSNIQIALVIDNSSSELRKKTLKTFDYFFIPPKFTSEMLDFNMSHNNLRIIETNYFNYDVPLVFFGLKDFDDIELCAHYSGTIFQCDQLALPSSRFEPLDAEKVAYVDKVTKSLLPHHEETITLSLAPMQVSE